MSRTPTRLATKLQAWRSLIPDGGFRAHITNEWLNLVISSCTTDW